jgi:hypothetical protein
MRPQSATASEFEQLGMAIMNRGNDGGSSQTRDRRFRSHFGATPEICAHVWDLLDPTTLPRDAEKKHLLWALMFLMLYKTESVHCSLAGGVDEKTFRSWAFLFVYEVSLLEGTVVSNLVVLFVVSSISKSTTYVMLPFLAAVCRLCGSIVVEAMKEMTAWSLLMQLTAESKSMGVSGIATSSRHQVFGMKLLCLSRMVILFGSRDLCRVGSGRT